MTLDIQYLLNIAIGLLSVVAGYLFARNQDHEKRIQRIEDVYAKETEKLSKTMEEVKKELAELTLYVHQKMHDDANRQSYTDKLIDLMYKRMVKDEPNN